MKTEYDFSNAERGKFYKPGATVTLPMSNLKIATMTNHVRGSRRKARLVSQRHFALVLARLYPPGYADVLQSISDALNRKIETGPRAESARQHMLRLARVSPVVS